MNNIQHLQNALTRAQNEDLMVIKNGAPGSLDYIVLNQERSEAYNVTVENGLITSCSCPHSHYRQVTCKHMVKVSMEIGIDMRLRA